MCWALSYDQSLHIIPSNSVQTLQAQMYLSSLYGAKGVVSYSDTSGSYTPSVSTGYIPLPFLGVTLANGQNIITQIRGTPEITATIIGRFFVRDVVNLPYLSGIS
jgi:hypothetical protein